MRSRVGRHGHGVRHGSWACALWAAGYGRGLAWGMGVCWGGRSPMATAGGGGERGPHTKESIKCIPQSGTLKNQKEFLP